MSLIHPSRRSFLTTLGSAGIVAPAFIRNLISAPPSGRVRHASFGAGGMAGADIGAIVSHPSVDMVAAADVDAKRSEGFRKSPHGANARFYQDWRELLEKESKNIDSISIGTPDHMHGPQAMAAMQLGIHCYLQKPLAQNIYEVRKLTEYARERKLITQMGIQVHSDAAYRACPVVVRSGVVGKIKEVHTWSSKKWGDSAPKPTNSDPVPDGLAWDLWLGVAAERPYVNGAYHPGNWRKRLDFGTGTFGDMGCHIYDPVFHALELTSPISVKSVGPAPNEWSWAINAEIEYVFPGTKHTADKTVKVTWYDGDKRPPQDVVALLGDKKLPDQGSIFIGTNGAIVQPHVGMAFVVPSDKFKDFTFEKPAGGNHRHEFIDAILGKGATSAGFDYSGPLTEAVLLGGVATFHPNTLLEWDAAGLKVKNNEDASRRIKRTYRKGWEVKGL